MCDGVHISSIFFLKNAILIAIDGFLEYKRDLSDIRKCTKTVTKPYLRLSQVYKNRNKTVFRTLTNFYDEEFPEDTRRRFNVDMLIRRTSKISY